jgi:hypothetical protein
MSNIAKKVRISAGGWFMGFCRKCRHQRPIISDERSLPEMSAGSSSLDGKIVSGSCDCCGHKIAIAVKPDASIVHEDAFQIYYN